MTNSWKEHIDNRLGEITTSTELAEKILENTAYKQKEFRTQPIFRKCIAVSLVVCMLVMGSITTFATVVPAVNDWIYSINSSIAERLYPINKTVEEDGIKVEVLYAVNDAHNAVVYFSVQDTTGNRVDDSTDIYNYNLEGPFCFNCQMISYDEQSHTAVFQLLGTGGENMSNKMTTLAISSFLSNKIEHDWYDTQINLADIVDLNATSEPMSNYDYNGGGKMGENSSILIPEQMQIALGDKIDFLTISNMGFVDGKLHIQTKWNESVDDHGQLNVVDANGNEIASDSYYFNTDTDTVNGDLRSKHIEYTFEISDIDSLSNCHLWATFTEDGDYTEGNWEVNFRLSNSENIVIDSVKEAVDTIEVSSLGMYFNGYKGGDKTCFINMVMKDGTELSYNQWNTSTEGEYEDLAKRDVSVTFGTPLNLEDIETISLNGTVIYNQ